MSTAAKRDPATLPPAPPDEWWHRAAERIDSACAAAIALNAELLARQTPPTPPSPGARPALPDHLRDLDTTIRARNARYSRSDEYAAAQLAQDQRDVALRLATPQPSLGARAGDATGERSAAK